MRRFRLISVFSPLACAEPQKPNGTACRTPFANPSMVVTVAPAACTASMVQDFTARPST